MSSLARTALTAGAALVFANSAAWAQRGGPDWTTAGNDAQRSHWLRSDPKISMETLSKPGFELLWKVKLNNAPRQMSAVTPPALLDFYIGYRGFRTLGFFGGSSDTVTGIDTDLARIEWEKKIGSAAPLGPSTIECPGGMTTSVARITSLSYAPAGFGRGRGAPPVGTVGEPGEGAVTLKNRMAQRPAAPPPPKPTAAAAGRRRQSAPPNVFGRGPSYVYALSGDGKLHLMYVSNGEEPNPAMPFLPANAHAVGLIIFDNTAYVATVNGCGGVPDGVWALDLESKKVTQWKSGSGKIAGNEGFAVSPDGMIYVAAGNELAALDSETLTQKGSFKTGGATLTSTPLVFPFNEKDAIAVSSSDGKLHIVQASGLVPLGSAEAGFGSGTVSALTTWQETGGTRYIAAPTATQIVAMKVVNKGGIAAVEPGWQSTAMVNPLTPAVVNDVIFAVSAGKRGTPAVLHALDASSGKSVWNSGKSIPSFVTTGGLSAGGSRVYVSTHDGTQYAFGIPMEH